MAKRTKLGSRLKINKPKKNIDELVKKLHPKEEDIEEKSQNKVEKKKEESNKKKSPIEGETVKTSIHYPKELYTELKVLCAREGLTLKEYIMNLIKKDIERRGM